MTNQPNNGATKGLAILGRNGIIGVMLALVLLVVFVMWIYFNTVSNHIEHSTEASIMLTAEISKLGDVQERVVDSLDNLEDTIRYQNSIKSDVSF